MAKIHCKIAYRTSGDARSDAGVPEDRNAYANADPPGGASAVGGFPACSTRFTASPCPPVCASVLTMGIQPDMISLTDYFFLEQAQGS